MFPVVASTTPAHKMFFDYKKMGSKTDFDNIRSKLPFKSMSVGQSFFIPIRESTAEIRKHCSKAVWRYNTQYLLHFRIIKRRDAWEVARIY